MKKVLLLSQWQRQLDNTKSNHIVLTQFSLSPLSFFGLSQLTSTFPSFYVTSFILSLARFFSTLSALSLSFIRSLHGQKNFVSKMQRIFKFLMFWFSVGMLVLLKYYKRTVPRFFANEIILKTMPHSWKNRSRSSRRRKSTQQIKLCFYIWNTDALHLTTICNFRKKKTIERLHFSQCFNFLLPKYFDCSRSVYRLRILWKVWMKNYWKFIVYPHGNSCYDQFFGFFFRCAIGCKLQSISILLVWKSILNENCLKTEQKKSKFGIWWRKLFWKLDPVNTGALYEQQLCTFITRCKSYHGVLLALIFRARIHGWKPRTIC